MVTRKKVAIFDWEWGRNSALEMGRNSPVSSPCCPLETHELPQS